MSKPIKAILFDIDGTLVRFHGTGKRSLMEATKKVFGTSGLMEETSFLGQTDPYIIYQSLLPCGISKNTIMERIDELKMKYESILKDRIKASEGELLPGVFPLLENLQKNNECILGLLTGNFRIGASVKLSVFNLEKFFSFGAYGDDAFFRNDLPEIARDRLHAMTGKLINYKKMVIIGDTVNDIKCAQHSGTLSIAVGTGWEKESDLLAMKPDIYFKNLENTEKVLHSIHEAFESYHI